MSLIYRAAYLLLPLALVGGVGFFLHHALAGLTLVGAR